MLKSLNILNEYRTGGDNPLQFYISCLENSNRYDRAAGYFRSSSMAVAAKGFSYFIHNGGKIRMIASPELLDEDVEAMKMGYKDRDEIIFNRLNESLKNEEEDISKNRLNTLAWLIANNQLEIKVSIRTDKEGNFIQGIYHEKFGIFKDENDDMIAFTGSSNETASAYTSNFESIDTFKSWIDVDNDRVESKCTNFNKLWNNSTDGLIILNLPTAVKNNLIKKYKSTSSLPLKEDPEEGNINLISDYSSNEPEIKYPDWLKNGDELYDYQKNHIEKWFENDSSGIFEMATGTGKTITALAAATDLYYEKSELAIIITCPNTHLVTQWEKEVRSFGYEPFLAFKNSSKWLPKVNRAVHRFNRNSINCLCIITNNQSFFDDKNNKLLDIISKLDSDKILFIADEVHNLGAIKRSKKLPENARYRIGLSATPEIYMNDIGTNIIKKYFRGVLDVIPKVDLKFAIQNGYLAKYNYYPTIVYLNDEESEEYYELSKKIKKLFPIIKNSNYANEEGYQRLLEKRIAILNNASSKMDALMNCIEKLDRIKKTIFFCSDKQIDSVCELLNDKLNLHVKKVTYKQREADLRNSIFNEFDEEIIDAMCAMGVLDEGLDIPSSKAAFILSSSGNPKQFIQRRGRILRKGKDPDKIANIYDFISIPNASAGDGDIDIVKKALERELIRFSEFADDAENSLEAKEIIWDHAQDAGVSI